jgi:hypothetical protein
LMYLVSVMVRIPNAEMFPKLFLNSTLLISKNISFLGNCRS